MSKSLHKCPVCDGDGSRKNKKCHACKGKGYIAVDENKDKKASKGGMVKYGRKNENEW